MEVAIKTDQPYDKFVEWFTALGEPVTVVPCDSHRAYIYFAPLGWSTPDETIRRLCQQIADLPGPPRQQWDAAGFREFFLGYETGDEPFCYDEHLSHETLLAVTSVGAGIGFALYACRDTKVDA
ncbi:hypothetical protein LBMAG56_49110 [Verrucomicrobiota bacterium]|nr:hypothetical protein LBMAG56_49110 [Verrucomicrobiota bacterium]